MIHRLIFTLLILVLSHICVSQVYKWVGENGRIQFSAESNVRGSVLNDLEDVY